MRLVDLDAKEPYLLDGRYAVGVLENAPTVNKCDNCEKEENKND